MKNYIKFIVLGLGIACGDYPHDEDIDIDSVSLAYSARRTDLHQLGTTTSHARLQCARTSEAQSCTIPTTKNPTYYLDNLTNTTVVRNIFNSLDSQLGTWTFTETNDIQEATIIVEDNLPCSGSSSSNNIEAFGCVNLTATGANLVEGSNPNVVGNYTTHDFGVVHIDLADILAKFSSGTERSRLYQHAAGHGIVAWMGLGSREAPGNSITDRTVNVSSAPSYILSNGENCRVESLNVTNNGRFDLSSPVSLCPLTD